MKHRLTTETRRPQRMHGEKIKEDSLRTLRLCGESLITTMVTTETRRPQRVRGANIQKNSPRPLHLCGEHAETVRCTPQRPRRRRINSDEPAFVRSSSSGRTKGSALPPCAALR